MLNVDIDTGGTMTDGSWCSGDGAGVLGEGRDDTARRDPRVHGGAGGGPATDRGGLPARPARHSVADPWSSTITSNALAQKTGPRLGLLVSAGHEDDLYSTPEDARTVDRATDRLATTSPGSTSDAGDDEVRTAVKRLFDKGIRRINISPAGRVRGQLRGAQDRRDDRRAVPGPLPRLDPGAAGERDPAASRRRDAHVRLADQRLRAPGARLGAVPGGGDAQAGALVARQPARRAHQRRGGPHRQDHRVRHHRVRATVRHPRQCPTRPARHGDARVLAIDVGGTTAKVSAVEDGAVVDRDEGELFGIPVRTNLPLLRSIALGGGSVGTRPPTGRSSPRPRLDGRRARPGLLRARAGATPR